LRKLEFDIALFVIVQSTEKSYHDLFSVPISTILRTKSLTIFTNLTKNSKITVNPLRN